MQKRNVVRRWKSAWLGQPSPTSLVSFFLVIIIACCLVLHFTPSILAHLLFNPSLPVYRCCPSPWYTSSHLSLSLSPLPSPMVRQKVKEQIAQDRAALAAKREAEKQSAMSQDLKAVEPAAQLPQSKPAQKKEYDTCRLQVSRDLSCSEPGGTHR